jgi:capsular exopolysaccharide synthesis family protein
LDPAPARTPEDARPLGASRSEAGADTGAAALPRETGGYQESGLHLARPYVESRGDQLDVRRQFHVVRKHLSVIAVMSLVTTIAAAVIGLLGRSTWVGRVTLAVRRDSSMRASRRVSGFLSEETIAGNVVRALRKDPQTRTLQEQADLTCGLKGMNEVVLDVSSDREEVVERLAGRAAEAVNEEFASILRDEIGALEKTRKRCEQELVVVSAEMQKMQRKRRRLSALESLYQEQQLNVESLRGREARLRRREAGAEPAAEPSVDDQTLDLKRRKLVAEIVDLELRDTELRERYHPGHPRRINTAAKLKKLREQLAALQLPSPGRDNELKGVELKRLANEARADVLRKHLEQARKDAADAERTEVARQIRGTVLRGDVLRLGERIASLKAAGAANAVDMVGVQYQAPPSLPRRLARTIPFGLMLGVVMGVLFALGMEHLRDTCSSPGEVYHDLGLPTLAIVPRVEGPTPGYISSAAPHSELAEMFSILRNNLRYSASGSPQKLVMVTSPRAGDGKSMIAANLAISYASEGLNVLLVDADLRRSRGYPDLALPPSPGMVGWLEGEIAAPEEGIVAAHEQGLFVMPAGDEAINATKLVSSPRMGELLQWADERFDVVVVDTPAVLPVADTTIFANLARAVVLVIDSVRTKSGEARAALSRLSHVRGNVVGVVLNRADQRTLGYMSTYGVTYGYGSRYEAYAR